MKIIEKGIGRLAYLIATAALAISLFASMAIGYGIESSLLFYGGIILSISGHVVVSALRIKNIGYSKWLALILLIPIINSIAIIAFASLPSDLNVHKKLDAYTYIIALTMIVLLWLAPFLIATL